MSYLIGFSFILIAISGAIVGYSIFNPTVQIPIFLQVISFIGITLAPYLIGGMIFMIFTKWVIREIKK
jgi:hypothetical protein